MSENNLSNDVINTIISFMIGTPEYLNIKYNHCKSLKRIQNKYKFQRTEPKQMLKYNVNGEVKREELIYSVFREIPLKVESISSIIGMQDELLDTLIETHDIFESFNIILKTSVKLMVRYNHVRYNRYDFTIRHITFNSDKDCIYLVDIHNLTSTLDIAISEICRNIEKEKHEFSILGVQKILFKLITCETV